MKLIQEQTIGARKIEIYKDGDRYEVFCLIGTNISRAYPVKRYVRLTTAQGYADDFLDEVVRGAGA